MGYIVNQYFGTNGAAPSDSTVWGTGGSANIQGDNLRITTAATSFQNKAVSTPSVTDGDALFAFTIASTVQTFWDFLFRNSSATAFANGYSFSLDNVGATAVLSRWTSGSDTPLDSATFALPNDTYYCRIRWQGSDLKCKIWSYTAVEPAAWTVEATDATYTAAGTFHYSITAGTAQARVINIQTLFIDNLNDAIGDGTQAGVTQSWGTPIVNEQFLTRATSIDDPTKDWSVFNGGGFQNSNDTPTQVFVADSTLFMRGDLAGNTGSIGNFGDESISQRWEVRKRIPYGDDAYHSVDLLWPFNDVTNPWPESTETDFAESSTGEGFSTGSGIPTSVDMQFNQHYSSSNTITSEDEPAFDASVWHNYAVEILENNVINGYIDGVLWFTRDFASNPTIFPPGSMRLGMQLDWYDDNVPAETRRQAGVQYKWAKRYSVPSPTVNDGAGFLMLL